uniref:UBA domain-containing protein n=1 Tax=Chaetoceros debilis TaxID=122233 RepID=A0A7S3PTM4_9STRA|mmetsp:Transcript_6587/g.9623  ORF Transcript_6587/g.9623 Transcript_6587/m.9623 type:complete len:658 (+) Transcript_6587:73-2046(+)
MKKLETSQKGPIVSMPLLDSILSLRMPRCSVCGLDWYNEYEGSDTESGKEVLVLNLDKECSNNDEKLLLTAKCKHLIPLPSCKCTTLMLPPDADEEHVCLIKLKSMIEKDKDELNAEDFATAMKPLMRLKRYCNQAMCKDCLVSFIETSKDVMTFDYRSETEPNREFSVGGKCTSCRKRFGLRALQKAKSYACCDSVNESSAEMMEWNSSLRRTISFLSQVKKLKYALSKSQSNLYETKTTGDSSSALESHDTFYFKGVNQWLHDTDDHSSDDCFSDDGDSVASAQQPSKKATKASIIPPQCGEIKLDLIRKCPKFKQEVADFDYIQAKAQTKEGRRELGIESDGEDNDDEISMITQKTSFSLQNQWTQKQTQTNEDLERDERLALQLEKEEKKMIGLRKWGVSKSPLLRLFAHQKNQQESGASIEGISKSCRKKKTSSFLSRVTNTVMHQRTKKRKTEESPSGGGMLKYIRKKGDIPSSSAASQGSQRKIRKVAKDSSLTVIATSIKGEGVAANFKSLSLIEILSDSDEEGGELQTSMTVVSPTQVVLVEGATISPSPQALKASHKLDECQDEGKPDTENLQKADKGNIMSAPNGEFATEGALSLGPTSNMRRKWDTSDISKMLMMGFHKDECIKALDEAKNDISLAINILLNDIR